MDRSYALKDELGTVIGVPGAGIGIDVASYIRTFGPATDNTVGLNAAIAAAQASSGVLYISGYVRADGAVIIPNDGAVSLPRQKPLRICGGMASALGYLSPAPDILLGASVLDLRYNGGGAQLAKIDTRGAGLLEIDHLAIISGGTDDYLFLRTTNTTLHVHHNLILGNAANSGGTCVQDFVRLGGDGSGTAQTLDDEGFFQGYGTIIHDNYYGRIETAIIFGSQCNGIEVRNETVSKSCGSAHAHGAPFVFETGPGGGQFACVIRNGTIEIANYIHVVRLDQTTACVFDCISAYDDFFAAFQSLVYSNGTSSGCIVIASWHPGVPISGVNSNEHTLITNAGFRVCHAATVSRPNAATYLGLGGIFYDTDLSMPIFSDGFVWRDAMGAAV